VLWQVDWIWKSSATVEHCHSHHTSQLAVGHATARQITPKMPRANKTAAADAVDVNAAIVAATTATNDSLTNFACLPSSGAAARKLEERCFASLQNTFA
jgi:hypothetical protein